MSPTARVMIEQGRKRADAVALDWPGWDRSGKSEAEALAILERYRDRYAPIAELAGLDTEFARAGELEVVERVPGIGMTDFYGLSMKSATLEYAPMTAADCERKLALLRACWTYFDDVAARVSPELRLGPRGGGRDRATIVRHANGAEIAEFAVKVGVKTPLEARDHPDELRAHREAFVEAIRDHNARGESARTWTLSFLIRHSAYHLLDHAWEMEDRDLSAA